MFNKCLILGLCLVFFASCTQNNQTNLGKLDSGAKVSFMLNEKGDWGIEISGEDSPLIIQQNPVQIEVFKGEENIVQYTTGYQSVKKEANKVVAKAIISNENGVAFEIEDQWSISGNALSLNRNVNVIGTENEAGFCSAIRLSTEPTVKWEDANYLAPGLLYGDPTFGGGSSPGGTMHYDAKRFSIREDLLSAPMFALSFHDGNWAAVMDLAPNGATTDNESYAPATTPVIDERIQFGALGAREVSNGGVEFGFWLPGTTDEFSGGFGGGLTTPLVRRRYNPVKDGFTQNYQVGFCFGKGDSFLDMERDVWRWAWESLNPKINTIDMDVVRRSLLDHLADHVLVVGDMAGVPFLYDAVTGNPGSYRGRNRRPSPVNTQSNRLTVVRHGRNDLSLEEGKELAKWAETVGVYVDPEANELALWPKVAMGFVSKGIESADQLIREGERDSSPRGQKMRELGLKIIDTYIRIVPMAPPSGEGFSLWTGKPDFGSAGMGVVTLRAPSEGMRTLIDVYRREKKQGLEHPEWLNWCQEFADWLLLQQREDGSFPRSWNGGKGTVREESGTSSYNPVPLLVKLSEETGEDKYLNAAIRAADYVWKNYGSKGIFIGGATDNPNIVDKEAGMLSLEAYLILFETTDDSKWLERAKAAGNYAETWIWIWNVPMPVDADDSALNWKRGVSTVGAQGITARAVGGVDQYMAWSVSAYAKLYKYTQDEHYLDVARVLLHNTKAMMAIPGREYDLLGSGWQQEHWQMGPHRGYGGHRSWLPWVSVNHLHGITGLEEFDLELYKQLTN